MNGRVPPVASNMRPARAKAYQRSYNETFASEVYAPGSIPENDAPFSNTRMPGCCCCSSPLQGGCTLLGEAAAGSNVLIDATAEDGTDTMMDVDVTTVREASAMDMDVSRATSSVDRVIDVSEQGARVFHPRDFHDNPTQLSAYNRFWGNESSIGSVSSPTYINTKNEDAYDLGVRLVALHNESDSCKQFASLSGTPSDVSWAASTPPCSLSLMSEQQDSYYAVYIGSDASYQTRPESGYVSTCMPAIAAHSASTMGRSLSTPNLSRPSNPVFASLERDSATSAQCDGCNRCDAYIGHTSGGVVSDASRYNRMGSKQTQPRSATNIAQGANIAEWQTNASPDVHAALAMLLQAFTARSGVQSARSRAISSSGVTTTVTTTATVTMSMTGAATTNTTTTTTTKTAAVVSTASKPSPGLS